MARDIQNILAGTDKGAIPPELCKEVEAWLVQHWESLDGGTATKMAARKLDRIEDLSWDPPTLSFRIERHGATVNGSTRAEMQEWAVDTKAHTAAVSSVGRRQLYKADARLNVKPLAEEIARAILEGRPDPRLSWKNADHAVLRMSEIIPATNQRTTAARRRRFRTELQAPLKAGNWEMSTPLSIKRIVTSN